MTLTGAQLEAAHRHSVRNRGELARSATAGCFYCRQVYPATAVEEWTDGGETAICPRCPCDSVIGDAAGFALSPEFLEAMHRRWFAGGVLPLDGRKLRVYAEALVLVAERLRQKALDTRSDVTKATTDEDRTFESGRNMAYFEVLDVFGSVLDLLELDRSEVGVPADALNEIAVGAGEEMPAVRGTDDATR